MLGFWFHNGTHEPVLGETINVVGAESETAEVWSYFHNFGSWGAGTAGGFVYVISCSADFINNFAQNDVIEDIENNAIAQATAVSPLQENCSACHILQVTGYDVGMECLLSFKTDDIDADIYLDGSHWPE